MLYVTHKKKTHLSEDDIPESVSLGLEVLAEMLVPCDKVLVYGDKWRA